MLKIMLCFNKLFLVLFRKFNNTILVVHSYLKMSEKFIKVRLQFFKDCTLLGLHKSNFYLEFI